MCTTRSWSGLGLGFDVVKKMLLRPYGKLCITDFQKEKWAKTLPLLYAWIVDVNLHPLNLLKQPRYLAYPWNFAMSKRPIKNRLLNTFFRTLNGKKCIVTSTEIQPKPLWPGLSMLIGIIRIDLTALWTIYHQFNLNKNPLSFWLILCPIFRGLDRLPLEIPTDTS